MYVWSEFYWYWFGYWRLHLDASDCLNIAHVLNNGGDIGSIIGDQLPNFVGNVTSIVSGIISIMGADFSYWANNNGVVIHFYALIPLYFVGK
ncbi:hypothetical protein [Spiroplasma endosymbiont of Tipula paludosa]